MNESSGSAFNFEDYHFTEANLRFPISENIPVQLQFAPKGIYDPKEGKYELTLKVVVYTGKNPVDFILQATVVANFKFATKYSLEEIPPFFYQSCHAILYPYIRSFISTLSLQANSGNLVVLPTMNLMYLHEELKKNTALKS